MDFRNNQMFLEATAKTYLVQLYKENSILSLQLDKAILSAILSH